MSCISEFLKAPMRAAHDWDSYDMLLEDEVTGEPWILVPTLEQLSRGFYRIRVYT